MDMVHSVWIALSPAPLAHYTVNQLLAMDRVFHRSTFGRLLDELLNFLAVIFYLQIGRLHYRLMRAHDRLLGHFDEIEQAEVLGTRSLGERIAFLLVKTVFMVSWPVLLGFFWLRERIELFNEWRAELRIARAAKLIRGMRDNPPREDQTEF